MNNYYSTIRTLTTRPTLLANFLFYFFLSMIIWIFFCIFPLFGDAFFSLSISCFVNMFFLPSGSSSSIVLCMNIEAEPCFDWSSEHLPYSLFIYLFTSEYSLISLLISYFRLRSPLFMDYLKSSFNFQTYFFQSKIFIWLSFFLVWFLSYINMN